MKNEYDVTFYPFFLRTLIYFLLTRDYHHSKFGLIWIKESKVTEEGGGGADSAPQQIENVLNRLGDIELRLDK